MTRSALQPTEQDLQNFAVAVVAVTAAFVGFSGTLEPRSIVFYLGASVLVLLVREAGIRTIGQWMDAEIDLELSEEGLGLTFMGAVAAYLTGWPIILLFPIWTTFSVEPYEQWGKSVDVIWMKREYWLIGAGVLALLLGTAVSVFAGWNSLAKVFAFFLIFQLLPFDYPLIPTGTLDGAYILRWSGFIWLISLGLAIVFLAVV